MMTLGCSLSSENKEQILEQEKKSDSFWYEKEADGILGDRNDPQWKRVCEVCMVTGGQ